MRSLRPLARWCVVSAGAAAIAVLQGLWVNARLMQSAGYGGPTWIAWLLLATTATLLLALLAARRRARPTSPAMARRHWAGTLWIWWATAAGQWSVTIAHVSLRDPWDRDPTPLETLLLLLAAGWTLATALSACKPVGRLRENRAQRPR